MIRPEFDQVLKELKELHDLKSQGYGMEGDPYANLRMAAVMGIPDWAGVVLRLGDKWSRLATAVRKALKGEEMTGETVEDTFLDTAVYGILGLILYREWKENPFTAKDYREYLENLQKTHPEFFEKEEKENMADLCEFQEDFKNWLEKRWLDFMNTKSGRLNTKRKGL